MDLRVLAVIPVRGGSKRVERKNLREVDGKPLVADAIEDVQDATVIDHAVVSTDDEEIRSVAEDYGGHAPFLRPQELATDEASSESVITHALDWLESSGEVFDIVCMVQATAPLRTPTDIDEGIHRLVDSEADSVVSVAEYVTPPQWAVVNDDTGFLAEYFDFDVLWENTERSQELRRLAHPNGAFFAAYVDAWRDQETFYTDRTVRYEMPQMRSFDIDEPWELELVRALVNR